MNIQTLLEAKVKEGFLTLFETTIPSVEFQVTRKDFEGDTESRIRGVYNGTSQLEMSYLISDINKLLSK